MDNGSRAHVTRFSQVTEINWGGHVPKVTQRGQTGLTLQPVLCLHPKFPVSLEGSPKTQELHSPHLSSPAHPWVPRFPGSVPPHCLCRGEGKGLPACFLVQCTVYAVDSLSTHSRDAHPGPFTLAFAVSFLPALDWGSEYWPLVEAHSFLPSFLPYANIHYVPTTCEAECQ